MSPAVLHVSQTTCAGVARCVLDLAGHQAQQGWEVTVATPETDGLAGSVRALGGAHHVWAATRSPMPSSVGEAASLARIVTRVNPDVVHLHSSKAGLIGRLVIRGRIPTLFQPHGWSFLAVSGMRSNAAKAWERFAARWTTTLLCVSEAESREGKAVGIEARFEVLANAVDVDRFHPSDDRARAEAQRRLGLNGGPLVVCVGRLAYQKGQDILLAGWARIREQVPTAQLAIVGDARPGDGLQLPEVIPMGVIIAGARTDIPDWLTAADVVVLPSRWEGMSYVMLEAMASGRSVVATDVGGAREAVGAEDDRTAGALVPPEDPDALAAATVARLLDRDLARREGTEGVARARARHDRRRWLSSMDDITTATMNPVPSGVLRP